MRREGKSLSAAAHEIGTTPKTVRRYARPALRKKGRYYRAVAFDRLPRDMILYDYRGEVIVRTMDSRIATEISRYHHAIGRFLTGDPAPLREFEGRSVRVDGQTYPYLTDHQALRRLQRSYELSTQEIYATGTDV
jgi:hypothetical protein